MTLLELLALLLVAAVCGATAQAIAGFSGRGCLVSIGVGFIGALIGTWLARLVNLPDIFVINLGGVSFPIVWTLLGSVLFVVVIGLATARRR